MPKLPRRDQLIRQRQQLSHKWQRHYDTVAQLLDRLVAEQSQVIKLRDQITMLDWELDKLVDEKIATAWEASTSEDQVR